MTTTTKSRGGTSLTSVDTLINGMQELTTSSSMSVNATPFVPGQAIATEQTVITEPPSLSVDAEPFYPGINHDTFYPNMSPDAVPFYPSGGGSGLSADAPPFEPIIPVESAPYLHLDAISFLPSLSADVAPFLTQPILLPDSSPSYSPKLSAKAPTFVPSVIPGYSSSTLMHTGLSADVPPYVPRGLSHTETVITNNESFAPSKNFSASRRALIYNSTSTASNSGGLSVCAKEFVPTGYSDQEQEPVSDSLDYIDPLYTVSEYLQMLTVNPADFETILQLLLDLIQPFLNNMTIMMALVDCIFYQTLHEANFRYSGARICRQLSERFELPDGGFERLLLNRCCLHYQAIMTQSSADDGETCSDADLSTFCLLLGELIVNMKDAVYVMSELPQVLKDLLLVLLSHETEAALSSVALVLKLTASVLRDQADIDMTDVMNEINRSILSSSTSTSLKDQLKGVLVLYAATPLTRPSYPPSSSSSSSSSSSTITRKSLSPGKPALNCAGIITSSSSRAMNYGIDLEPIYFDHAGQVFSTEEREIVTGDMTQRQQQHYRQQLQQHQQQLQHPQQYQQHISSNVEYIIENDCPTTGNGFNENCSGDQKRASRGGFHGGPAGEDGDMDPEIEAAFDLFLKEIDDSVISPSVTTTATIAIGGGSGGYVRPQGVGGSGGYVHSPGVVNFNHDQRAPISFSYYPDDQVINRPSQMYTTMGGQSHPPPSATSSAPHLHTAAAGPDQVYMANSGGVAVMPGTMQYVMDRQIRIANTVPPQYVADPTGGVLLTEGGWRAAVPPSPAAPYHSSRLLHVINNGERSGGQQGGLGHQRGPVVIQGPYTGDNDIRYTGSDSSSLHQPLQSQLVYYDHSQPNNTYLQQ